MYVIIITLFSDLTRLVFSNSAKKMRKCEVYLGFIPILPRDFPERGNTHFRKILIEALKALKKKCCTIHNTAIINICDKKNIEGFPKAEFAKSGCSSMHMWYSWTLPCPWTFRNFGISVPNRDNENSFKIWTTHVSFGTSLLSSATIRAFRKYLTCHSRKAF